MTGGAGAPKVKDGVLRMGDSIYNYTAFPVESDVEDFQRFPEIVKVGTHAPETVLTDLETGELVNLRDVTRQGLTILEFGSLT